MMDSTEHEALAAGLRDLADWIEAHPELTLPQVDVKAFPQDEAEPPHVWTKALGGKVEKDYSNVVSLFYLRKPFGPVPFSVVYNRSTVCKRVVKGTETVEVPAVEAQPARVEEREIVEWVCDEPILKAVVA